MSTRNKTSPYGIPAYNEPIEKEGVPWIIVSKVPYTPKSDPDIWHVLGAWAGLTIISGIITFTIISLI